MVHYHSFRRLSRGEKLTFQDVEKFSDRDNQNEITDHRLNEGDRERRYVQVIAGYTKETKLRLLLLLLYCCIIKFTVNYCDGWKSGVKSEYNG